MTDDTTITWRTRAIAAWAWLQRAYAWCGGHQVATAFILGTATGWLLPKILRLVL